MTALRTMLAGKIHRATVTEANLEYEGSITIDRDLMDAAGILPYEQVQVLDITNGSRLTTYAIEGDAGTGCICVNGAAAHLVRPGDLVIILAYVQVDATEARDWEAHRVFVDHRNRIVPDPGTGYGPSDSRRLVTAGWEA